jgi:hypothetical protein
MIFFWHVTLRSVVDVTDILKEYAASMSEVEV